MKTLLYGGTFDPPHNGHMNNLRAAAAELKKAGGRGLFARAESYPCASSDIRSGKIPREQWPEVLPPEVLAVIQEHRLYGSL